MQVAEMFDRFVDRERNIKNMCTLSSSYRPVLLPLGHTGTRTIHYTLHHPTLHCRNNPPESSAHDPHPRWLLHADAHPPKLRAESAFALLPAHALVARSSRVGGSSRGRPARGVATAAATEPVADVLAEGRDQREPAGEGHTARELEEPPLARVRVVHLPPEPEQPSEALEQRARLLRQGGDVLRRFLGKCPGSV